MAEVTYLHAMTDQDIPVARVLEAATACQAVLVLGTAADGTLYASASTGDVAQLVCWMEQFKHAIFAGEYS
jgi:hypothetical protein